jgi:hypothetical protein
MSSSSTTPSHDDFTSAFFASGATAAEAVRRLSEAGFGESEVETERVAGGSGVRVTVHAQGDRRSHAMRVLDDNSLLEQDEAGASDDWGVSRWWGDDGGGMNSDRSSQQDWGQVSMTGMLRSNPLMAVGLTFMAGLLVGTLARRF